MIARIARRLKAFHVDILNEQKHVRVSGSAIRRLVRKVLEAEESSRRRLTVYLTDNRTIRRYNRQYLNHPWSTDVIAFDLGGMEPSQEGYLGDVMVSCQMAKERAAEFGSRPGEETLRYIVHGVLHLLGHRDKSDSQKKRMMARQEKYLSLFGVLKR